MNRSMRFFVAILFCSLIIAGSASASTHYIAADGSDSNDGTSKTAPWQHAPGMPSCASSCASYKPVPGDQFIFRGGDTWHFGAGSPLIGGTWKWTWGGSSGSPIYIGVDETWFSGTSFSRPILNGDNPLSTSFVSSCAHDYGSAPYLVNLSVSWLTFDNFEMKGVCWSSQLTDSGMLNQDGGVTNDIISNFYCHGWTMTSGAWDNFVCILNNGGGTLADYNQYAYDIFDGSDSPHFPAGDSAHCQWGGGGGNACGSGQGIYGRAYDVHNCVFRYLSNFMVTNTTHTVHDNLFEYLLYTYASGDQQHPNVINNLGGPTGDPIYFYNNVMRHTYVTENIYLAVRTTAYVFNNVFYDNMNSQYGVLPSGCIRFNSVSNSAASQSAYIYNNTEGDSSCQFIFRRPIPLSPLGTVRQLSKITISLARLRCRMLTTLIPVSPRRLSTTEMKFFSLQVRLPQKATPRQIILPRLNRATPPLGPARMSRDPAALSRAIRHFAAQRRRRHRADARLRSHGR